MFFFLQDRISHVLRFISIYDLLTDSPSYTIYVDRFAPINLLQDRDFQHSCESEDLMAVPGTEPPNFIGVFATLRRIRTERVWRHEA
jgi:hypothetical protein